MNLQLFTLEKRRAERDRWLRRDDVEGDRQDFARSRGIDDRVDPASGGGVTNIGLAVVTRAEFVGQAGGFDVVDILSLTLERGDGHVEHRFRRLARSHHRVASARPGEEKSRVERLAAKRVMPRAEGMADDQGDLGHDAVAHGVDHLRARRMIPLFSASRPTSKPLTS